MKRAALGSIAATLLISAIMTGCGQDDHDVDALDSRVLQGTVQQFGGDDYYDSQWVKAQIRAGESDAIMKCMKNQGKEIVSSDLEHELEYFDQIHDSTFPPVERYRREGVSPKKMQEGLSESQNTQLDTAIGCRTSYEEQNKNSPGSLYVDVRSSWSVAVDDFLQSNDFTSDFSTFSQCLEDSTGYPGDTVDPGSSPDVYGFLDWWKHEHGGDNMSDTDNLEGGELFGACADPYFEVLNESISPTRTEFIDQHYDELSKLNGKLVG